MIDFPAPENGKDSSGLDPTQLSPKVGVASIAALPSLSDDVQPCSVPAIITLLLTGGTIVLNSIETAGILILREGIKKEVPEPKSAGSCDEKRKGDCGLEVKGPLTNGFFAIFGYVPDRHLSFCGEQTSTSTPVYAGIMNLTLVRSSVTGPDSTFAQAVSAPKPIVKPSDLLLPAVSTVKSTLKQSDIPPAATSGAAKRTSSASSKSTDAP
jgi:hypothetical protein